MATRTLLAAGEGVLSTYMRSGYYYGTPGGVPSNNTTVQDFLYATPLYVPSPVTFDRIGFFVALAGSAGSVVRLGMYLDDGNGWPAAKLLDAGTVATDSGTGGKEIIISQAVSPGLLWLVACPQVAAPPQCYGNGNSPVPFGGTTITGMMVPNSYVVTGVTGALPGSYGTPIHPDNGGIRVIVRTA